MPLLKAELHADVTNFKGGKLADFTDAWGELTTDPEIMQTVSGVKIEFDTDINEDPPLTAVQPKLSDADCDIIDAEVQKLIDKRVLESSEHEEHEFISPVFTRPKKDGSFRMILNLKNLNKEVTYYHFKMETLASTLRLVTKNCFMASIDLKDAYYSVPVAKEDRKYLKFVWKGKLLKFTCLPNGLALAPRKFTKMMKPVFATLRGQGFISSYFIDDSLLLSLSAKDCVRNIEHTVSLMRSLGFTVHPEKSVFTPSQRIQYLGVVIDSTDMTVRLTLEKAKDIQLICSETLRQVSMTIRFLAKVIGKLVAACPAVKYGPLHFRHLEEDKKRALCASCGKYNGKVTLSSEAKQELMWWRDSVLVSFNDITISDPDISVNTDASRLGWGGVCQDIRTGGEWSLEEQEFHINYLELKAVLLTLQSLAANLREKHVRVFVDNSTAVSTINMMGTSHSMANNDITFAIWEFCIQNKIWLSAAFIPGKENVIADFESRHINLDAEWQLQHRFFNWIKNKLNFTPTIDLFASRLNFQLPCYCSYRPDPGALAVDAFTISWSNLKWYAFPPFSVINAALQKIQVEQATGILIVPDWPTQIWYPVLLNLLVKPPMHLPHSVRLLTLPNNPEARHQLLSKRKLKLMACLVSGAITKM